jgi:hypothetical protein
MFVRVAYDPGPTYQQRLHQTDFEMPDGATDEVAIREAHRQIQSILGVAVWDGASWRTIKGSLP